MGRSRVGEHPPTEIREGHIPRTEVYDPDDVIASLAEMIALYGYPTQILAASFKNAGQVDRAFLAGAQTATMDPSILISAISQPHIDGAVEQFMNDWRAVHGETLLCQL